MHVLYCIKPVDAYIFSVGILSLSLSLSIHVYVDWYGENPGIPSACSDTHRWAGDVSCTI